MKRFILKILDINSLSEIAKIYILFYFLGLDLKCLFIMFKFEAQKVAGFW